MPRRWQVWTDLIKHYNCKVIAEIGVYRAESAIPVLEACGHIEKYYMVDPLETKELHEACLRYEVIDYLKMTSRKAARLIEVSLQHPCPDMVIIDASHDYKNVKQDTKLWKPLVRKGGIISWHDYENRRLPGVKRAVTEIFEEALIKTIPVTACKVAWVAL